MAWTAPKTWSVGELVTAANLNIHLRDNLKYLKGQAGTVTLEDLLKITAASSGLELDNTSSSISGRISSSGGGQLVFDINRDFFGAAFDDTAKSHARMRLDGNSTSSFVTIETAAAANTVASERVRVAGDGKVGIGTTGPQSRLGVAGNAAIGSTYAGTNAAPTDGLLVQGDVGIGLSAPQGRLHGYDVISGFIHWEFDGVDGTARTVIPNGTGDAPGGIGGSYIVLHSGGTTRTGMVSSLGDGTAAVTPGTSQNIYNVGGNTLALAVAADGSVTVQRTAGSGTYKVALWLIWL